MTTSLNMLKRIKESALYIANNSPFKPDTSVVLGTGLGDFIQEVDVIESISYNQIPGFSESTVEGHFGKLVFAVYQSKILLLMQGRFHFYEGYTMDKVTFPIRVMKYLGVKNLILTNASGGMNPDFNIGDIMIIKDHINMMPNPLIGPHHNEFGARFPDMSLPYDPDLIKIAKQIAKENKIPVKEGCYVAVSGPTYETPAEYRFYRTIGGDAIGMSTVPEVIVARQMEMRCFAASVITDLGVPGKITYLTHEDVQKAAEKAEPTVARLIKELILKI